MTEVGSLLRCIYELEHVVAGLTEVNDELEARLLKEPHADEGREAPTVALGASG